MNTKQKKITKRKISSTPETDAAALDFDSGTINGVYTDVEFARKLERQKLKYKGLVLEYASRSLSNFHWVNANQLHKVVSELKQKARDTQINDLALADAFVAVADFIKLQPEYTYPCKECGLNGMMIKNTICPICGVE